MPLTHTGNEPLVDRQKSFRRLFSSSTFSLCRSLLCWSLSACFKDLRAKITWSSCSLYDRRWSVYDVHYVPRVRSNDCAHEVIFLTRKQNTNKCFCCTFVASSFMTCTDVWQTFIKVGCHVGAWWLTRGGIVSIRNHRVKTCHQRVNLGAEMWASSDIKIAPVLHCVVNWTLILLSSQNKSSCWL